MTCPSLKTVWLVKQNRLCEKNRLYATSVFHKFGARCESRFENDTWLRHEFSKRLVVPKKRIFVQRLVKSNSNSVCEARGIFNLILTTKSELKIKRLYTCQMSPNTNSRTPSTYVDAGSEEVAHHLNASPLRARHQVGRQGQRPGDLQLSSAVQLSVVRCGRPAQGYNGTNVTPASRADCRYLSTVAKASESLPLS